MSLAGWEVDPWGEGCSSEGWNFGQAKPSSPKCPAAAEGGWRKRVDQSQSPVRELRSSVRNHWGGCSLVGL